MILKQIEELSSSASAELDAITALDELEVWRVRYLGRKSTLIQALRSISDLPVEERRSVGARANEIKRILETAVQEKKKSLEQIKASALQSDKLDVSLPGKPFDIGRLHPTTQILIEICDILKGMGFQVVEGPEVEWEY